MAEHKNGKRQSMQNCPDRNNPDAMLKTQQWARLYVRVSHVTERRRPVVVEQSGKGVSACVHY